jgi:hypothetical protein
MGHTYLLSGQKIDLFPFFHNAGVSALPTRNLQGKERTCEWKNSIRLAPGQ